LRNSDQLFPIGALDTDGYINIAIFDQYLAICGKRYKIGHSYYKMVIGNHMRSIKP